MQHIIDEPAFPIHAKYDEETIFNEGLFLRDYFAARAMQGILSSDKYAGLIGVNRYEQRTAEDAYKMADAMLIERQK